VESSLHIEKEQSMVKMLAPQKAAQIIINAMERDRRNVLVGQDSKFMNFICRVAPQQAAKLIYTQMKTLLPI